jgi:mercuric reductase
MPPHQSEKIGEQRMDRTSDFDLLVIGGGSAGFAAAIAACELDKRVGIVNSGPIGGTCTNFGCIPSKALIRAAEVWHQTQYHPFEGVTTRAGNLDWNRARQQKDRLIESLRQSRYVDVLAAHGDIAFMEGRAVFQRDGSVQVGKNTYRADRYVIATGGRSHFVPFPGVDEVAPLTSTTLMELPQLPKSLLILGGRAVALELGQMMARFGVEVSILQRSPRLVPEHEPEIGQAIQDYLQDEGIHIVTDVQVERLRREGEIRVVQAHVLGQLQEYRAEQILMALGRHPNTDGLGLENVGVELTVDGAIVVNEFLQTNNPHIYAVGDVTPNPEYVYVAAAGGTLAARNAVNGTQKPFDLSVVPGVIFTNPQIAMVGLTEAQARQAGYDVRTSTASLDFVAHAQVAYDTLGFIKLVADNATNRLLGAHVLADKGGEVIQSAVLAVKFGLTFDDLRSTLFPYLTQVEGLKLATLAFTKDLAKLSCCAG